MNHPKKNKSSQDPQDKLVENTLRAGGFLFPQTVEEVQEFERTYGDTNYTLPPALEDANFLFMKSESTHKNNVLPFPVSNQAQYSMAARQTASEVTPEIHAQIMADIELIEKNKKNTKK